MTMAMSWRALLRNAVHVRNDYVRCFMAEFFGTFVLVFLIDAMAATATFNMMLPGGRRKESVDQIHLALGSATAVMAAVLVSGGVSGAHLNPALTGAFALMGRLSWKKMFVYMLAQYAGGFLASIMLYGVYYDTFNLYDGGVRQVFGVNATAGIFATYPNGEHLSWTTAFFDQIIATAVLMFGVLSIVDPKNWEIPKSCVPIYIALLIMAIVLSLGYNTGAAMNPARDLMPRLFTYLFGWGSETFSVWNYNWFWIPIIGSHLGAVVGAGLYQVLIGAHWPDDGCKLTLTRYGDLDMKLMKEKDMRAPLNSPVDYKARFEAEEYSPEEPLARNSRV